MEIDWYVHLNCFFLSHVHRTQLSRAIAILDNSNASLPIPCSELCSCRRCYPRRASSSSQISALPSQEDIISALYNTHRAVGNDERFPHDTASRQPRLRRHDSLVPPPPPYVKEDPEPELSAPLAEGGPDLIIYVAVPSGRCPGYSEIEGSVRSPHTSRRPIPLIQL